MGIDSVLHIVVGGLLTIMLFSLKARGITILLALVTLAASKEFYDHTFTLGHCYPICMEEHATDFLFSLLFFFLYLPFLSFTQKSPPRLTHRQYALIWTCIVSTQLGYHYYSNHQKKAKGLNNQMVCSTNDQ